jgi:hypothetical protein
MNSIDSIVYDKEGINYDDIPELTRADFARAKKSPFPGMQKDGYTFIIHHSGPNGGWDEVRDIKEEDISSEIKKAEERYAFNSEAMSLVQ